MVDNNEENQQSLGAVDHLQTRFFEDRMNRIENKIDNLSEAMISLARTEAKILELDRDRKNIEERLNRHADKIDSLTEEVHDNTKFLSVVGRFWWLVFGALAAGYVAASLSGGFPPVPLP